MHKSVDGGYSLYDMTGRREYLVGKEMLKFLKACDELATEKRLFCELLFYTGCRVSEALELTPQQLDAAAIKVVFRTLKRRKTVHRGVPVPSWLMRDLIALCWVMPRDERIWKWCRQTAWRYVKTTLDGAGVTGPHTNPKGLRHAFGISMAERNISPAMTQRWMGHARLETTAIYQQAFGQEERIFAQRFWRDYAKARL